MTEIYEKYLEMMGFSLSGFFEQQKPYIFCKEGCSSCCETGEYPFTSVEFNYAMSGFEKLAEDKKTKIKEKAKKIINDKKQSCDSKFLYECPFLIDKKCSIYDYRGIICRTHGLAYYEDDKEGNTRYKLPHCVKDGLNYSIVYDEKTEHISSEKWKQTSVEAEPISFNISLNFLLNNNTVKNLGLEFGESKSLIDWFL